MFRILVVRDDKNTRRLMEVVLEEHGYHPILARDRLEALKLLDTHHVDLVILDVMIPGMDGYELTRQLRATGYTLPILMVTAKQLPRGKWKGFIIGTGDYMTRPVDEEEMTLRIRALLRGAQIVDGRYITIGDIRLGYDSLTANRRNESQTLPRKEFYLLYKFLSYPDKILIRIQLTGEIWGIESQSDDNTVDVHINWFRKRPEDYPEFTIETMHGLGYKVVKNLWDARQTINRWEP